MAEKDHYKVGLGRKIDPSIPALRARIRRLEGVLASVAQCQARRCDPCGVCVGLLHSVTTEKTEAKP